MKNSLLRAAELNIKSIAFPAIGTGVSEFDPQLCAEIMLFEINRLLPEIPGMERVEVVLFDKPTFEIFSAEYEKL